MSEDVERELKFQVPPAARAALRRAVATPSARRTRLRALYFDTDDRRLASAGLALRLRQEDRRWLQTLKGRGDGVLQRQEHELVLPAQRGTPSVDPARHAGSAVGEQLLRVLGEVPLQPVFRTEIERTHRRVRHGGGTVEVALDEGRIVAGERTLPVCEIEFEWLAGARTALAALAARWMWRHGLWLDVRTKAERGWRLAQGSEGVEPAKAAPVALDASAGAGEAFAAMARAALAHALPNAAELADGRGTPEHVHQLRVGLRRLRTALRLFGGWSADPAAAAALEAAWREPFGRLGAARDADVLHESLAPLLAAAGAPPLAPESAPLREDPGAVVRDRAFGELVLRAVQLAESPPPALHPLRQHAARVLKAAQRRVAADAERFAGAEPLLQHRARKRLKRLRYATEFLQPVLPARPAERALATMRQALDALGAYTDALLAAAHLRALPDPGPGGWFALGWLAARRRRLERRAARGLARVAALHPYWRR